MGLLRRLTPEECRIYLDWQHYFIGIVIDISRKATAVKRKGSMYWYVCMVLTYSEGKDQPGKVDNPARGQLNKENEYSPVPVRA